MNIFELVKLAAAVWYLSYCISTLHGPFGVFEWIREHMPLGGLTACIICLSVWVAMALVLIGANVVTDAFAVAGVALLAHSYSGWRINI